MADWYTPTQVQRALETTWIKLEHSTTPLTEIKEDDLMNYYDKKHDVVQDDAYFNTKLSYNQKIKKDTMKSQQEIHNSIYDEEARRIVPVVTSHQYGHRHNDLEGRMLNPYKRVEYKDDYRRSGLPMNDNPGFPRNPNEMFVK